jgi:uroporphyrinogen III methyltransferase/synthase
MAKAPGALEGRRVVVTRAAEQCAELCQELEARGCKVIVLPLVRFGPPDDFAPLDAALGELEQFGWIFLTSANSIRAMDERCETLGRSLAQAAGAARIAVVGPATEQAALKAGLKVSHVAASQHGVGMAEELSAEVAGATVLLPRSDRANPALPEALRRLGAEVTEVTAYRTLAATGDERKKIRVIENGAVDAILLFSPSAVHHLRDLLGAERMGRKAGRIVFAAIGPVTAAALRECGIAEPVVARDASVAGIVEALAGFWGAKSGAGARQA